MHTRATIPRVDAHTEVEDREEAILAPYAMRGRESRGRAHPEAEHAHRGPYQRDRDRVVHCTAFRRMAYKTQVFVNHEGDHYRSRLTHTIEVSQIARSLARALRLSEDLAEVLALVHDIGHPPFGHSGEEALDEEMHASGGFNHNRHALRVVERLENRYPAFPGLNLSYEVREGIAKHSAKGGAPHVAPFHPEEAPLLEAQAADLADSIAYDSHDVEDALNAGLLEEQDLAGVGIFAEARARIGSEWADLEPGVRRYQLKRTVIDLLVTDAIEETGRRIARAGVASLADVRSAAREPLVGLTPAVAEGKRTAERFLHERVYRHHRVARMAKKAKRFVTELFRALAADPAQLPPKYRKRAESEGTEQAVCDYIAGMTDRFAQDEWLRLFQPFERV